MSPDSVGPLSRPFPIGRVTPGGIDAEVEASAEERAALAADLGLPAIHRLRGTFRLTGSDTRISVTGRIKAEIEQLCVLTLDPFRSTMEEAVEVEFKAPDIRARSRGATLDLDPDEEGPEELSGDQIDLGAVTAEFLVLGLDPYPRKPGVDFAPPETERNELDSPFGGLAALRGKAAP